MELDGETFLDELMSLRQEASAAAPWQGYQPGGGVMMSNLLFYGGEGADVTSSGGMDLSPFQELVPMPPVVPPQHLHEDFNFECLSEVCNPYRSCVAVPGEAALRQTLLEEDKSFLEEDWDLENLVLAAAGCSSQAARQVETCRWES